MKTTADIIIVGGGNAGCTLAYLLSQRYSVILLEAGTDLSDDPRIFTPSESGTLINYVNKYFYPLGHSIKTSPPNDLRQPQPGVSGEILGGGSSVNGMQYVRGTGEYFERWAAAVGDPEWGSPNVSEVYKRIERFNGVTGNFNPTAHGYQGPLDVKQIVVNEQAATVFTTAASVVGGVPNNIDYNDLQNPLGSFVYFQATETPTSLRASSFTAYLKSILRKKKSCDNVYRAHCTCKSLQVVVKARVQRINFEDSDCKRSRKRQHSQTARSVSAVVNGECVEFCARKKVILTAGFQSASLLQLSGIGDSNHLSSICVDTIIHNPNVGQHVVNHPIISITGAVTGGAGPFTPLPPNYDPQGLYSGGAQLSSVSAPGIRAYQLIGVASPTQVGLSPSAFTIIGLMLDAKSQGYIQIDSSDPNRPPLFDFKYFSDPSDITSGIEIYTYMYNILVQMGLSPLGPDPSDTVAVQTFVTTQYRQAYHWTGMTRMSRTPSDGVVDTDGKVFRTSNLYVADISVAPFNALGNTQALAYLIPNIIADKLLREADC
jgi:choline dehydrogenase